MLLTPAKLFAGLACGLIKRHPLARWRKQRQRSASFGATGARTVPPADIGSSPNVTRHLLGADLIFYQKEDDLAREKSSLNTRRVEPTDQGRHSKRLA
jgi:hypothetical protein